MFGSVRPRLETPPLRELTRETSYGYDVIDFAADVLGQPLDLWQQHAAIHLGELLPDGRPRFRTVLIVVARQNGKTELAVTLVLYWLFVERQRLTLSTSTNLTYAKESWNKAIDLAMGVPELADEIPSTGVRRAAGEEALSTVDGCRYKIAASNRRGGRSLTINRLVLDELREHDDWSAWGAAVPAMNAVPDAQVVAITNQGDDTAVVLESLRKAALEFIATGEGDARLGLLEWSAPDGSVPTSPAALAQANPNLGYRMDPEALLGDARRAVAAGGEQLATFKTEVLCMRVNQADPAIDPDGWAACADPGDLADVRRNVALCVDVSMDMQHATLVAAAVLPDGRARVETVAAWSGPSCTSDLRWELPKHVARVKPKAFGWFPSGPAAAVAADLADSSKRYGKRQPWPPRGVAVEEIRADVTAVCMGLAELVRTSGVAHSDDPLLTQHVHAAQKVNQGDGWRFGRRGSSAVDATYAMAGAVHLARTLPPGPPPLAVV